MCDTYRIRVVRPNQYPASYPHAGMEAYYFDGTLEDCKTQAKCRFPNEQLFFTIWHRNGRVCESSKNLRYAKIT